MKKLYIAVAITSLISLNAFADRALPAQADDIAKADANLGDVAPAGAPSGQPATTFGAKVSAEAKTLKNATVDQRKSFGDSVADQRERVGTHSPNSHASSNATLGNSIVTGGMSDPRSQVPAQGGASSGAGRPVSPGKP